MAGGGGGGAPPEEEVRALARKYGLQNAVQHDGSCEVGPVMGRIMGERPDWRAHARTIMGIAREEVAAVNAMAPGDQRGALEGIDPSLVERQAREREHGLPDLEGAEGGVVMRFAPGPSGPLHVGHSRAAVVNDEYVRRYGGTYILRLEDTDPARVLPEAYDMIKEDMDWLGCDVGEVHVQTDRFDLYYAHAAELLEAGAAYVCLCPPDDWRAAKAEGRACPHREEPPEVHLERWEGMLDGTYGPEKASVVVKTDLADPNPALRDFVALRITEEPHPRTGDRYRVYPLYNYSVVVDDHHMGLTHVLRGKDHLNNTLRQRRVYDYLGWEPPLFHHYGFVSIADTVLKTSHIKEALARGEYTGWDDPRLGTLRALARRGISPDSLRRYWVEASIRPIEMQFSWKTLFAHDRDVQEPSAPRLFFVKDPVELSLESGIPLVGHAPFHPDRPGMGVREVPLEAGEDGRYRVVVPRDDLQAIEAAGRFRLKDLANFESTDPSAARCIGDDLAILKEGVPIVHWARPEDAPARVLRPDGAVDEGVVEEAALGLEGRFVQFERYGFGRIEADPATGGVLALFAYR